MSRKPTRSGLPALAHAALELIESVESLERLSGRAAETELSDWKSIAKTNELLEKSVAAHQEFVTALSTVSDGVTALRDRHNTCADRLAEVAARLQQRRDDYAAFEQRFHAIAGAAREINSLLEAIPQRAEGVDAQAHLSAVSAAFAAVRERLSRAAEEARVLGGDAKAAGFVDLTQQAEGLGQQLEAISSRLARATPQA